MAPKKEKEIPQMGPGSKIKALVEALRKMLTIVEDKKHRYVVINFKYVGFRSMPLEVCKNEELSDLTEIMFIQYNHMKALPVEMEFLKHLRYIDMTFNIMTKIPFQLFMCTTLEYVSYLHHCYCFKCVLL